MNTQKIVPALFAGDVHGNLADLEIAMTCAARNGIDTVIQVGDFWIYDNPQDIQKLERRAKVCENDFGFCPHIYFIDGNHENYTRDSGSLRSLNYYVGKALDSGSEGDTGVPICDYLTYMPRGSVMDVGGLTIGFVGGADSIDKQFLVPGKTWFPEEELTESDYRRARRVFSRAGGIDVLVSHDTSVPAFNSIVWRRNNMLEPSFDQTRHYLTELVEEFAPKAVVHGHHHYPCVFSATARDDEQGGAEFTDVSLSYNGNYGFLAVLEMPLDGAISTSQAVFLEGRTKIADLGYRLP